MPGDPVELPDPDIVVSDVNIEIIQSYPKGFRLLVLMKMDQPKTWRDWRNFLWGFDIWFSGVPMAKTIVLANLVMWALMWAAGR